MSSSAVLPHLFVSSVRSRGGGAPWGSKLTAPSQELPATRIKEEQNCTRPHLGPPRSRCCISIPIDRLVVSSDALAAYVNVPPTLPPRFAAGRVVRYTAAQDAREREHRYRTPGRRLGTIQVTFLRSQYLARPWLSQSSCPTRSQDRACRRKHSPASGHTRSCIAPWALTVRNLQKYHEWMTSAELRELTASEPLTLDEEYEMQRECGGFLSKLPYPAPRAPRPRSR